MTEKDHLQAYDMLKSVATWLENPDNEVFGLLEHNEDSLSVVAEASILAAAILKKAALDVQLISGIEDSNKYAANMEDVLDSLRVLADDLDSSGDPELCKKASVLDEILLTMADSIDDQEKTKLAMSKKIEEIKARAEEYSSKKKIANNEEVKTHETNEKKEYRPLEAPLSTRSFPGAPGVLMARKGDGDKWYNIDTGEEIDFSEGYQLDGKKVPGTSVGNQTSFDDIEIPNQFK